MIELDLREGQLITCKSAQTHSQTIFQVLITRNFAATGYKKIHIANSETFHVRNYAYMQ